MVELTKSEAESLADYLDTFYGKKERGWNDADRWRG